MLSPIRQCLPTPSPPNSMLVKRHHLNQSVIFLDPGTYVIKLTDHSCFFWLYLQTDWVGPTTRHACATLQFISTRRVASFTSFRSRACAIEALRQASLFAPKETASANWRPRDTFPSHGAHNCVQNRRRDPNKKKINLSTT